MLVFAMIVVATVIAFGAIYAFVGVRSRRRGEATDPPKRYQL